MDCRGDLITLSSKLRNQMTQAVIMAAGKSTRTYPLTLTKPKPLLKIANKPILEHQLEQLVGLVEEVLLVVGYRKEMIQAQFGNVYRGLPLRYVIQEEQLGTGHAAMQVQRWVRNRFIILNGDDLYHRQDIRACLEHRYAILTQEVENPRDYGVLLIENGLLRDIVEKSPHPPTRFVNAGLYVVDETIFDVLKAIERSPRGEYELTSAMKKLAETRSIKCQFVQKYWIPVVYPWSLLKANELLLGEAVEERRRAGGVGEALPADYREYSNFVGGRLWGGPGVSLGEGVEIEGTVWVGPGSTMGPGCRLKGFVTLGDHCSLGAGTVVENSLIGDGARIGPFCRISDSVFGEGVQIDQGFKTLSAVPEVQTVRAKVKNTWIDTGRSRLGTILGDRVRIGQNVVAYPGVSLDPEVIVPAGSVLNNEP